MSETWSRSGTLRALKPVISVLDRHIERVAARRVRESKEVIDLRNQVTELRSELQRVRSGGHAVDILLGPQGRRSSRLIGESGLKALAAEIQAVTGDEAAYPRLVQTYRMLFELELRGVGRIAGGVRNILGKLATTPMLKPPNGEVLEIGTLFGLFSGGMARQVNRIGLPYTLTIVDPLATVQLQDGDLKPDASGSPVTETVVRANLLLSGVEPERVRLVKGFSQDPDVQTTISDRSYGIVIVDGDHSAAGVARDLELAESVTAPGGVVVLDDYGSANWPGVEVAVKAHLERGPGGTRFDLVGVVATSAYLRAVR